MNHGTETNEKGEGERNEGDRGEGGRGRGEREEGEYIHRGQIGDFRWLEEAMGRLTSLAHRASFGMVITTRQVIMIQYCMCSKCHPIVYCKGFILT